MSHVHIMGEISQPPDKPGTSCGGRLLWTPKTGLKADEGIFWDSILFPLSPVEVNESAVAAATLSRLMGSK